MRKFSLAIDDAARRAADDANNKSPFSRVFLLSYYFLHQHRSRAYETWGMKPYEAAVEENE